jgi:hypothetical protein
MILRVSPALQDHIQVSRENGMLVVKEVNPKTPDNTNLKTNSERIDDPEMHIVLTITEWQQLHRQVFYRVTGWAEQQKLNHLAMAWRAPI